MRCEKLTKQEREFFFTLRAMNRTVKEARKEFYEHYPEAEPYSFETMKRWTSSAQGKEEFAEVQSGIRSTARDESFANKDSRIIALVELAEKDMANLRMLDPVKDNREYTGLSKDFRELLAKIAEEVDPYNMGDEKISSSVEDFVSRLKDAEGPDWVKDVVSSRLQIPAN